MAITVGELRRRLTEVPESAKIYVYVANGGEVTVQAERGSVPAKAILTAKVDLGAGGECE